MKHTVDHPDFKERLLTVELTLGLFPKINLYQGVQKLNPFKKDFFMATDDNEQEREIKVKGSFYDPVPVVKVDNEVVYLVDQLNIYERALVMLPMLFITFNGLLGGIFAVPTIYVNGILYRKFQDTPLKKVIFPLLSSTVSFSIMFLLALLIITYLEVSSGQKLI